MKKSTLVKVTSRNGSTFVGIRGYEAAKTGEVSNRTIVAGYSYENAKAHDLVAVQAANAVELSKEVGYPVELVDTVLGELTKSLTNPDKARSEGQENAYTHLGGGIKRHNDTKQLYLIGLEVRKQVLVEGEYKVVKSADKTICKNKVKKALGLRTDKIRTFILDNGTFNMRGLVL